MSDRMRMTGMFSGMDTESIVQQLVSARQVKVDNLKNDQKKLEWKQTAWQDLNSKIYSLWGTTLTKLRLPSSYQKKSTTVSDVSKATVLASASAANGTHSLKINQVAKSGYMTGAKLEQKTVTEDGKTKKADWTTTDKLSDLAAGVSGKTITVTVGSGEDAKKTDIVIKNDMTIADYVTKLQEAGVNASFDTTNQRFFISAKESGTAGDFFISESGSNSSALKAMGLDTNVTMTGDKVSGTDIKSDSLMTDIDAGLKDKKFVIEKGGKKTEIEITDDMTVSKFLAKIESGGLKASFDEDTGKFTFGSTNSARDKEFKLSIDGDDADGTLISSLGLKDANTVQNTEAVRIKGQDSEIELNGAKFTSSSNAYTVNGLTINTLGVTDGEIQIVTSTDYSGIYDTIKDFITEYNELINEMDKTYNADSARKYNMLSEDEKASMTDDEVEQWEDKIKSGLLRKDSQLNSVMSSMINMMMGKYYTVPMLTEKEKESMTAAEIAEWETKNKDNQLSLYDFGIKTLSYFEAADNEHHAYHIDGDSEDETVSAKTDKLKAMIAKDPEGTANFFANLCSTMYTSLKKQMESTSYSSIYKVYNDKQLKKDYDNYTKKIKEAEKDLSDYEDRWYDKFSAMEKAMAKMQSQQSSLTGMLG